MGKYLTQAQAIRAAMDKAGAVLTDAQALTAVGLYRPWKAGEAVKVGDIRQYSNNLYKCLQAHTTQSDWTPSVTPALWVQISVEEWPEWKQPAGAHDAYKLGDKVTYNNKHWISTADANVYAPGVYGWSQAA